MGEIVMAGLFMYLFKETSRNAYTNDRSDAVFTKNYYRQFKKRLPHPDTIDRVMRKLPPDIIEELKMQLVSNLFDQKVLRKYRFKNKYYFVAVDATGIHSFDHKHCDKCLTKTSKNGVTTWFHYVLEAKIITSSGLAISLASEFIENDPERNFDKQDCELKAFVRLAQKIKKRFPRLPICILADGLYPNQTVFNICHSNKWLFIITLKDDSLDSFQEEVELLNGCKKSTDIARRNKTHNITLFCKYINSIDYKDVNYSWVSCEEIKTNIETKEKAHQQFIYITNIEQTSENVIHTIDAGRMRWKIENEGFNTQKNQGYAMEHKYSRVSYTAMQNYYHLMQIAHMVNQFTEHTELITSLLHEHSKQTIKALWKDLISFLKSLPCNYEQLYNFLSS